MGRIEKQKRFLIEQANKRLLGEQNGKVSDKLIEKMEGVQGLVTYEVKPGDSIHSIVKNSRQENSINLLDFDHSMNKHIIDPNLIYPGDILFFMTDPTGNEFRTADEVDEYIKFSQGDKEPMNESLLLTAAILAYRQTAKSKSNRLTRKIKKALKDNGIKNKVIVGGNFNKLMSCINSSIDSAGNQIKGDKNVNKNLVRNTKMFNNKKNTELNKKATESFEAKFDENIVRCGQKFKLTPETQTIIKTVMLDTIKQFQNKTFRL